MKFASLIYLMIVVQKIETMRKDKMFIKNSSERKLCRLKRNTYEKNLNVPKVQQTKYRTCGPAVGESILRHFGLTTLTVSPSESREETIETTLAVRMNTASDGTHRPNFLNALNNVFFERNLANGRRYTQQTIENRNRVPASLSTVYREMYHLIRRSIENNMPVPFLIEDGEHCVLIEGFQYAGRYDTVNYHVMDPRAGQSRLITAQELIHLTRHNVYLLVYAPPYDDFDAMDFLGCEDEMNVASCSITVHPFSYLGERRSKRSTDHNCPAGVDPTHVIMDASKDFFGVSYAAFDPDEIKISLTLKTVLGIEKVFYERNEDDLRKYLKKLFKSIRQLNGTGLFGSIQDSDYDVMVNYIFDHYAYVHYKIRLLAQSKDMNLLEIYTNRGSYFDPKKMHVIYYAF